MLYQDRYHAGRQVAARLLDLAGLSDVLVLGIPRGGVVVAHQIALALTAPLDVYLARKLGAPGNPELAIGAISADGEAVVDHSLARAMGADETYIQREVQRQRQEIERRLSRYRGTIPFPQMAGRTVILVDDGAATGSTLLAAARALKAARPREIVIAVPVASHEAADRLSSEADRFECPEIPAPFWAVGAFYRDFEQTDDEEVIRLLHDPSLGPSGPSSAAGQSDLSSP